MNLNNNFDLTKTLVKDYFIKYENTIEIIPNIKNIIYEIGRTLSNDYEKIGDDIWINKTAKVANNAVINGPCIIESNVEIRHCAYIRGSVIIGKNSVIGNSVELKNCILFDSVQVPHFNYIGDSILGYKSHFGAGAITSNVKSDKSNIELAGINTNLRKMGAIVGDNVEIGCNSVLCPGTIIGNNSIIYPLTQVRGIIERNSIVKSMDNIVKKKIVYLDFDSTLYDTQKFLNEILEKCEEYGIDKEEILKRKMADKHFNIYNILKNLNINNKDLYNDIKNIISNGKQYIYDDVYDFISAIKRKKYEVNILTYGDSEFQNLKIQGCGISKYVNNIIISETDKSDISYIDYNNAIFIDDNPTVINNFLGKNAKKVIKIKRNETGYNDCNIENKKVPEYKTLIDSIDLF